jgi:arabinogalactan endo-1,4-beta-galactosidase
VPRVRLGLWKVLLKPEQLVPPRVWYGMTCLLISDAIGSVSFSVAWGMAQEGTWIQMVQVGSEVRGNHSTASRARGGETIAKHDKIL